MRTEWEITFEYTNGVIEKVRGHNIAELLGHAREVFDKTPNGVIKSFDVNIVYPNDWVRES